MGEYKIILSWFISYLKHNYFLYSEKISTIDIIQNWVFAHAYKQTTGCAFLSSNMHNFQWSMIFFLQPTAVLSAEALINIGNKGKSNYLWLNYKFRVVPRISNTQNICSLLNFRGLQTWRGAQWGEVLHVFSTGVIHNPSLSQLCEKGENESMESYKPLPQPVV